MNNMLTQLDVTSYCFDFSYDPKTLDGLYAEKVLDRGVWSIVNLTLLAIREEVRRVR